MSATTQVVARMAAANDLSRISAANAAFLRRRGRLLIDGEWVEAAGGRTFEVRDPSSDAVIARVAEGDSIDVDRAVSAARAAFDDSEWSRMKPVDRERLMHRLADLIEKNADELAELESIDNGKSIVMARHVDIKNLRHRGLALHGRMADEAGRTDAPNLRNVGSRAGICRFLATRAGGGDRRDHRVEFSVSAGYMETAPALAAGCTVVLKPAEETSLSALRLGELIMEAGFPKGVFNIVTGMGPTAGAALAAHEGVDKITFTGSTEVGRLIVRAAAGNMKKVTVELGGKSPTIVLDDADLDTAIAGAAGAIFFNHGQVCSAGSRLFVAKRHFERVVEGVAAQAQAMSIGPGLDVNAQMGPLVSSVQRERVMKLVNEGIANGARAVTGGKALDTPGYYVQPTVFAKCPPRCPWCARRYSAPWSWRNHSTASRTSHGWPTIASTGWPPVSGAATSARSSNSPAGCAAARSG